MSPRRKNVTEATVTNKSKTSRVKTKTKSKPKAKTRKLFIIDTNVLLHDPTALFQFEDNDLAIPITVLEEVDHFKRGSDTINLHAREIARQLDDLASKGSLNEGVPMGEGLGSIQVLVTGRSHPKIAENLVEDTSDHRILSAALTMQDRNGGRQVTLVSKDVSLRLKARSLGLPAEDYESDKAPELKELYKGRNELENVDDALIDRLFQDPWYVPLEDFDIATPYPNSYFILRGYSKSAIARYDAMLNAIVRVEKRPAFGINPRNSEQTFALDALINPEIQLVTLSGKAGTGKTLLALAGALEARRKYHQIYLARPIIALSNKDIGYLPGEVKDKIDPYMQPLWDNLGVIRSAFKNNGPTQDSIQSMLDNDKLLISALAFIRGRSLHHIYFIVDEAQNLTGHEVKTIITRAGESTKIVFTGDPQQIDSPYLDSRSNGLSRLIDKMKGQKIYAHVTLEKGERSQLSELASNIL